jgi:hypothetical protein
MNEWCLTAAEHLGNGKAPGPDDVVNEVIKMLPSQVKRLIHKLFVIMWATGCTPDRWKHSNTRLIHKKGNAMGIGNYRPIALAKTMFKLWTNSYSQMVVSSQHSGSNLMMMQPAPHHGMLMA